jgi:ribosomal protein L25 (general stress protein Ctc)
MLNAIKQFLVKLLGIKFVVVNIKDHLIEAGKVINRLYPGQESFQKLQVPRSKIIDFKHLMNSKEFILVEIEKKLYSLPVVNVNYFYDILTGELIQIDIYVNLTQQ